MGGGHIGGTLDIGGAGVVGYGIGVRAASMGGVNSERRDYSRDKRVGGMREGRGYVERRKRVYKNCGG